MLYLKKNKYKKIERIINIIVEKYFSVKFNEYYLVYKFTVNFKDEKYLKEFRIKKSIIDNFILTERKEKIESFNEESFNK